MMRQCLAVLLALCLAVGPVSALADGERAIQLGTMAIKDPEPITNSSGTYYSPGSYVYFGSSSGTPIKWRVLDADQSNAGGDGMFLLSEYLLANSIRFSKTAANGWQGSNAQSWCTSQLGDSGYFTARERAGMLAVSKADAAGDGLFDDNVKWAASSLSGETMFFLSVQELADYVGNYEAAPGLGAPFSGGGDGERWWLRSPSSENTDKAFIVTASGDVNYSTVTIRPGWAVRPALNIDRDTVLFASAAVGGKAGGASGLAEIPTLDTNEWKLTLKDEDRAGFTASLVGSAAVKPGDSISLSYSGAKRGTNEYVSAILTDAGGNALYYGRLVNDSEDGTVSLAIPAELPMGSYTLNVFSEQCSGDERTDYASECIGLPLTVLAQSVPELPRTGDDSRAALWMVLMAASCAGLLAVYGKKKKTE